MAFRRIGKSLINLDQVAFVNLEASVQTDLPDSGSETGAKKEVPSVRVFFASGFNLHFLGEEYLPALKLFTLLGDT